MSEEDNKDNREKDPWNKDQEPEIPDLFEALKKWLMGDSENPESPFRYIGFIVAAIAFIWVISGIYIVSPSEQAVVLRFGKYVRTVQPGIHWVPRIINSKYTENVQRIRNFSIQSEMLTTDENIVSVQLAVHYRVTMLKTIYLTLKILCKR